MIHVMFIFCEEKLIEIKSYESLRCNSLYLDKFCIHDDPMI